MDYVNQRDAASPRKFFLAGAACVRRVWHLLELSASREAVEAAEQFADGFISRVQLVAYTDAADVWEHWPQADPRFVAARAAFQLRHDPRQNHGSAEYTISSVSDVARVAADATAAVEGSDAWTTARFAEMRLLAGLYRCVMGNPFRPVTFSPAWRTDTALSLARGMYDARDFGALPILADALQDAGCDEPAILDHCRAPGEHVRGCWVVDLVLGKE